MRRKEREITEKDELLAVLDRCGVLRLAISDTPYPYIVPVNFGWEEHSNGLCLYFHGAAQGKKAELLARHPLIGFEADTAGDYIISIISSGAGEYRFEKAVLNRTAVWRADVKSMTGKRREKP